MSFHRSLVLKETELVVVTRSCVGWSNGEDNDQEERQKVLGNIETEDQESEGRKEKKTEFFR